MIIQLLYRMNNIVLWWRYLAFLCVVTTGLPGLQKGSTPPVSIMNMRQPRDLMVREEIEKRSKIRDIDDDDKDDYHMATMMMLVKITTYQRQGKHGGNRPLLGPWTQPGKEKINPTWKENPMRQWAELVRINPAHWSLDAVLIIYLPSQLVELVCDHMKAIVGQVQSQSASTPRKSCWTFYLWDFKVVLALNPTLQTSHSRAWHQGVWFPLCVWRRGLSAGLLWKAVESFCERYVADFSNNLFCQLWKVGIFLLVKKLILIGQAKKVVSHTLHFVSVNL